MDRNDKNKVIRDIGNCIEMLSDDHDGKSVRDVIGILRRCAFNIEGIDNILTEDMTDYQKVVKAMEMGFDIEEKWPNGIMVEYLGYYFWGFTDDEISSLRQLSEGGDTA